MECLVKQLKATINNSNLPVLAEYINNFKQGSYAIPSNTGTLSYADSANRCYIQGDSVMQAAIQVPIGTKISLYNPSNKKYQIYVTDWNGTTKTGNVDGQTYFSGSWKDKDIDITVTLGYAIIGFKLLDNSNNDLNFTPQDMIDDGVYVKIV
jgi:hypothetical protein